MKACPVFDVSHNSVVEGVRPQKFSLASGTVTMFQAARRSRRPEAS